MLAWIQTHVMTLRTSTLLVLINVYFGLLACAPAMFLLTFFFPWGKSLIYETRNRRNEHVVSTAWVTESCDHDRA